MRQVERDGACCTGQAPAREVRRRLAALRLPPRHPLRRALRLVQASEPYTLLDAGSWQVLPASVADALSSSNADFTVVGAFLIRSEHAELRRMEPAVQPLRCRLVEGPSAPCTPCPAGALGPQGLGKSALLNRLLGFAGPLAAAGPHPTPAFPVCAAAAAGRHCTRGVGLRVSSDRVIGLDTQPLFSASVLEDVATGWSQPPPALAAPALAAAGDAKAAAVPFEGAQALMQLQLAALLLSTCERVLVLCDGWEDRRTWELLATAEMLCRGIPDPSLPPPSPQPAAAGAGGAQAQGAAAAGAQQPRQAPPQEHLAEVRHAGAAVSEGFRGYVSCGCCLAWPCLCTSPLPAMSPPRQTAACLPPVLPQVVLVHVLPAGQSQEPTTAQLQRLERQLDAFFASSRLRRPGELLPGSCHAACHAAEQGM